GSAFISGSIVDGLGNARSDLDLFVVADMPLESSVTIGTTAGGIQVDIESYRPSLLRALADKINGVALTGPALWDVHETELDLYWRTAIGQRLFMDRNDPNLLDEFRRERLCEVAGGWLAMMCVESLEVADRLEAKARCQWTERAFGYAVDSYVARRGDPPTSPKWRFEKLARTIGIDSEIYEKAWRLKSIGLDRTTEQYLDEVRAFANSAGSVDVIPPDIGQRHYALSEPIYVYSSYLTDWAFKLYGPSWRMMPEVSLAVAVLSEVDHPLRGDEVIDRVAAGGFAPDAGPEVLRLLSAEGIVRDRRPGLISTENLDVAELIEHDD
ncbi:MAG: hypothetical protein HYU28_12085, partial [Actinobacteria bacterium]|nr:hypothetical protein [Actinomycetota bacterium]